MVDSASGLKEAVDDPGVTCIKLAPAVYKLAATLFIDRTLAIVAEEGRATLDGGGSVQLMFLGASVFQGKAPSDTFVALYNLDLINGLASSIPDPAQPSIRRQVGGAILSFGVMALHACGFRGNFAPDYGGAIANAGMMEMATCTFTDNRADKGGGAVFNYHGKMDMRTCTLTRNYAGEFGGAIFNNGESAPETHELKMHTCTLTTNSAVEVRLLPPRSAPLTALHHPAPRAAARRRVAVCTTTTAR